MSYLSLHYHVVFATKDRIPMIADEWRVRLHDYIGGCIRTLGGVPERVGGVEDHVHLLARLTATHKLADILREVKSVSSRWVHEELGSSRFGWQDGYAAFSVSASNLQRVSQYIDRQEEHHRRRSSREELEILLRAHGIEYDPQYLR